MRDIRKEVFLLAQEELKTSNVMLELATGVGKTKIALDLCVDCGVKNITVLIPADSVEETWLDERKKWNSPIGITFMNYKSAHKVMNTLYPPDLVILDECHHVTERNLQDIRQYRCPMLALSATVDYEKMALLKTLGFKRGIYVSLDEATENDLVVEYEMNVVTFKPNNTIKNILGGTKKARFYTTEVQALKYAEKKITQAKERGELQWVELAYINRMRLIRTLPSRIELTKRLLTLLRKRYPEAKILVFAPNIAQCEAIVPECFYHSESDSSGFDNFKAGKQPVLGSVNALSEGINVHADIAIIVAGLSKERHTVQRIGRIVRKTSEGKLGKAFLIVAEDTKDVDWCNNSLAGLDNVKYYKSEVLKL